MLKPTREFTFFQSGTCERYANRQSNRACYLTKPRIRAFCEEKPRTFASARKKKCECVQTRGKIAGSSGTKNLQNFDAGTRESNRSGCKVIDPCLSKSFSVDIRTDLRKNQGKGMTHVLPILQQKRLRSSRSTSNKLRS